MSTQKASHSSPRFKSLFHRNQFRRQQLKKPGEIPGTAIHTGVQRLDHISIKVHDFDEKHFDTIPIKKIDKSAPYLENKSKTWVQVEGVHDIDTLQSIWNYFDLHPLVQEDIVNVAQRPKVEIYEDYVFIVLRLIKPGDNRENLSELHTEQVSLILGKNYVLSFQETNEPIFDPIIKRLNLESTRLRRLGIDYSAYALLDTIVDHYFHSLEILGISIDELEELIIDNPENKHLQEIHNLRRDLIHFRKSIWSLRDGINSLIRDDVTVISSEVKLFLRDVYDHVVQVIDTIEANREMVYSLYDMYMSTLSNKMNEVMKVLTIIATIFIPLTFIAGIYGMNFDPEISPFNMPELSWYYGYPFSLLLMLALCLGMVHFFKRKQWF